MDRIIHEYLIHSGTMVLEPTYLEDDFYGTKVIEEERELFVRLSVAEIMNYSCLRYGSTFKGRKDATARLIHVSRKPPIVVCTNNEYYFFPTAPPTQENCIWFSKNHIAFFKKSAYNRSEITFINGKTYQFSISKNILDVQLSRTTLLQSVLNKNFISKGRKNVGNYPVDMYFSRVAEEIGTFQ